MLHGVEGDGVIDQDINDNDDRHDEQKQIAVGIVRLFVLDLCILQTSKFTVHRRTIDLFNELCFEGIRNLVGDPREYD